MKLTKSLRLSKISQRFTANTFIRRCFSQAEASQENEKPCLRIDPQQLKQLESESPSKDWFLTLFSSLKDSAPEVYERFTVKLDHLYESREELPLLKKELESVRQINTVNHEKITVVRHKIEDLHKEMNTMQTRISKEIQQEKEHALKNFAHDAVQILSEVRSTDEDLKAIASKFENTDDNQAIHSFVAGFKMVESSGANIFKRHDIHQIEAVKGGSFNKALHELAEQDTSKKESGIIKEIVEPGYLMGKNLLRKTKVILN